MDLVLKKEKKKKKLYTVNLSINIVTQFTFYLIQANLSITGGSCFLDAVVNDSRVVDVIQPPPGLQCLQLIVAPKGLGTALVTVYDIGLAPHLSASSVVIVLLFTFVPSV